MKRTCFQMVFVFLVIMGLGCNKDTIPHTDLTCQQLTEIEGIAVGTVVGGFGADDYWATNYFIENDCLYVDVEYSGGCDAHQFQLVWSGEYDVIFPPTATLFLSHFANNDPCEALNRQTLAFSLTDLRYNGSNTTVLLIDFLQFLPVDYIY